MTKEMRQRLRERTAACHEALHHDPLLARLSAPSLREAEYRTCLQLFWGFTEAVERARSAHTCWPELSLAPDLAALRADLGAGMAPASCVLKSVGPYHILGALYVAQGAAFGRSSMRANLRRVLPELPHHYFSLRPAPGKWQTLLRTLEEAGERPQQAQQIEAGALRAFADMAARAAACRASLAA